MGEEDRKTASRDCKGKRGGWGWGGQGKEEELFQPTPGPLKGTIAKGPADLETGSHSQDGTHVRSVLIPLLSQALVPMRPVPSRSDALVPPKSLPLAGLGTCPWTLRGPV